MNERACARCAPWRLRRASGRGVTSARTERGKGEISDEGSATVAAAPLSDCRTCLFSFNGDAIRSQVSQTITRSVRRCCYQSRQGWHTVVNVFVFVLFQTKSDAKSPTLYKLANVSRDANWHVSQVYWHPHDRVNTVTLCVNVLQACVCVCASYFDIIVVYDTETGFLRWHEAKLG